VWDKNFTDFHLLAGHRAAMIEENQFLLLHQLQHPPSRKNNEGRWSNRIDCGWQALTLIWSTLVISVVQTPFATSQQSCWCRKIDL
jgi:hypothetical protein